MEIYESILRIVHDPDGVNTMLIDYGTPLESSGIDVEGGQEVTTALFIKAPGITTFPRGNDSIGLEFTVMDPETSTEEAAAAAFNHILSIPKHSAPLLIATASGWNWRIASATIESWPSGFSDILPRLSYRIIGGAITLTNSVGGNNEYVRPDGYTVYTRPTI